MHFASSKILKSSLLFYDYFTQNGQSVLLHLHITCNMHIIKCILVFFFSLNLFISFSLTQFLRFFAVHIANTHCMHYFAWHFLNYCRNVLFTIEKVDSKVDKKLKITIHCYTGVAPVSSCFFFFYFL